MTGISLGKGWRGTTAVSAHNLHTFSAGVDQLVREQLILTTVWFRGQAVR